MKSKTLFTAALGTFLVAASCNKAIERHPAEKNETATASVSETGDFKFEPCDITLSGIHFTRAINGADTLVKITGDSALFRTGANTDYFSDSSTGIPTTTAPILLARIDNSRPFTFTARMTPGFTEGGTYNAAVAYLFAGNSLYQKLCFEQDERGHRRMVTVRTQGTSDDNNHDVVKQPYVYVKYSSNVKTVASYYSLDGKNWQMIRLYNNNYPKELWLGISSQSPKESGNQSIFEQLKLDQQAVSDMRLGL